MSLDRVVRLVGPGLTVVLTLAITPMPRASAEHAKDSPAGDPDNADHYMDRHSLTALGDEAAVHGRDQLNRSQMRATFTGTGDVDIYDGDFDQNSWAGRTTCSSGFNIINGNCDVFKVQFDTRAMAGNPRSWWLHLGCHELGHAAGLGHRAASNDASNTTLSCMRDDTWASWVFDQHDLDAINSSV